MGGKIRYGVGMLSSTPHNTTKAVVNDWREVKNARVAELKDASYRDSVFSGVFEVADKKDPFFEGVDGLKLEIKVHWYGRRPPSRWARALIAGKRPEITEGYSGLVGWNLGDPDKEISSDKPNWPTKE